MIFASRINSSILSGVFWCHRAAQNSTDLKGETWRVAEQHGWNVAVPGIAEWYGSGKSSIDQLQASLRGTEKDRSGQGAWSITRSEWSIGRK